jgi:hypothetical protein
MMNVELTRKNCKVQAGTPFLLFIIEHSKSIIPRFALLTHATDSLQTLTLEGEMSQVCDAGSVRFPSDGPAPEWSCGVPAQV